MERKSPRGVGIGTRAPWQSNKATKMQIARWRFRLGICTAALQISCHDAHGGTTDQRALRLISCSAMCIVAQQITCQNARSSRLRRSIRFQLEPEQSAERGTRSPRCTLYNASVRASGGQILSNSIVRSSGQFCFSESDSVGSELHSKLLYSPDPPRPDPSQTVIEPNHFPDSFKPSLAFALVYCIARPDPMTGSKLNSKPKQTSDSSQPDLS